MGRVYQKYADAIFKAASHRLGRWVAAPQVLHAFDDERVRARPGARRLAAAPRRVRHRRCQQKQPPASADLILNWKLVFADFGELQPLTDLITHLFHRL